MENIEIVHLDSVSGNLAERDRKVFDFGKSSNLNVCRLSRKGNQEGKKWGRG